MPLVTLYEFERKKWTELCNDRNVFHERDKECLERKNEKLKIFDIHYSYLRARDYVGFIKFKNVSFQIFPKILKKEEKKADLTPLLFMLAYCKKIPIKDYKEITKYAKYESLLEIFVTLFLDAFAEALKKGLPLYYQLKEDNSRYLRGKLLLTRHLQKNFIDSSKFYISYEEFGPDILFNQVIKLTLFLLSKVSQNPDNRDRIKLYLKIFEDVDLVPRITLYPLKRIRITKNMTHYKKVFEFCKLIINNSYYSFKGGNLEFFSFFLPMERLFEEFIFRFIEKNRSELLLNLDEKIEIQNTKYQKHGKIFDRDIRPDIIIEGNNINSKEKRRVIIDVKYKIFSREDQLSPSIGDLNQMYVYGDKFNTMKLVLVYPYCERYKISDENLVLKDEKEKELYIRFFPLQFNLKNDENGHLEFERDILNFLSENKNSIVQQKEILDR